MKTQAIPEYIKTPYDALHRASHQRMLKATVWQLIIHKQKNDYSMTTSLLPFASAQKISAPMQMFYSVLFNSAIALFVTYGIGNGEGLQTNWVFSMLIGLSIGGLINGMRRLIWKDAKPNRLAFLMVCCIAAPLGFYFGYSLGMLIYGFPLEKLFQHMVDGEHKLVIMSIIISLFFGILFLSQTALSERKL
jgi:hypothetical protein